MICDLYQVFGNESLRNYPHDGRRLRVRRAGRHASRRRHGLGLYAARPGQVLGHVRPPFGLRPAHRLRRRRAADDGRRLRRAGDGHPADGRGRAAVHRRRRHQLGVGAYGAIESTLTVGMVAVFILLGLFGFLGVGETLGLAENAGGSGFWPEGGAATALGCVGSAIWFFIGFEFACPMAEENRRPQRNIPLAPILDLVAIYILDSLFALAAARYADPAALAGSATPQTVAAGAMLGPVGYGVMALLTILASFTTANAYCAALPRMLYGMAREGLMPKVFLRINKRFRTPTVGIAFTAALMAFAVVYMGMNGTNAETVSTLISVACITWMISYAIVMIDVLVLRRRYPDYPRLWKAAAKIVFPIGLAGVAFAIWTLSDYLPAAAISMAVVVAFIVFWTKLKGIDMWEKRPLAEMAQSIRDSSERLPEWDEAVAEWIAEHPAAKES